VLYVRSKCDQVLRAICESSSAPLSMSEAATKLRADVVQNIADNCSKAGGWHAGQSGQATYAGHGCMCCTVIPCDM
jgi:hypothetical protein